MNTRFRLCELFVGFEIVEMTNCILRKNLTPFRCDMFWRVNRMTGSMDCMTIHSRPVGTGPRRAPAGMHPEHEE
jgi:hypothetical protein